MRGFHLLELAPGSAKGGRRPYHLGPAGVSCKLATLRQARSLIRLALRSSAHTEGRWDRDRVQIRIRGICEFLTSCLRARTRSHPVLAGPGGYWGQAPISLRCEAPHPAGEPKARRIWARTPKTRTQTAGRLFFSLAIQPRCPDSVLKKLGSRLMYRCGAHHT
jgi:hypothetical protein